MVLRAPLEPMLAAGAPLLPPSRPGGDPWYEMKWDGFRALAWITADGVRLQSRHGRDLSRWFPDVTRVLADHVPAPAVLDGEVLVWDEQRGRISFSLLQGRLTAGRRIAAQARAQPAHYVAFDLLQDGRGRELLNQPLHQRRRALQRLLASAPAQLVVCPHTGDRQVAESWLTDMGVAGIEGVVVKDAASPYRPGAAGWVKVRARDTADYIIGGVTGSLDRPNSLLVGRYDRGGVLRFVGQTHQLTVGQRGDVAKLLQPMVFRGPGAGHPWPCPLPAAWSMNLANPQPVGYVPVDPMLVVEVQADVAVDGPFGRLRHGCRFERLRPDLHPRDVDRVTATSAQAGG